MNTPIGNVGINVVPGDLVGNGFELFPGPVGRVVSDVDVHRKASTSVGLEQVTPGTFG